VQILVFSTMTRLLDILEDHLEWRGINYLRLDGATASADRGELVSISGSLRCCMMATSGYQWTFNLSQTWIQAWKCHEESAMMVLHIAHAQICVGLQVQRFNDPASAAHVFLLSMRAGGLGLNLQAADTIIM
jgi:hypothetical protein